jgi:hypothetical protein
VQGARDIEELNHFPVIRFASWRPVSDRGQPGCLQPPRDALLNNGDFAPVEPDGRRSTNRAALSTASGGMTPPTGGNEQLDHFLAETNFRPARALSPPRSEPGYSLWELRPSA